MIVTPRLLLRPIAAADHAALHALWADARVMADLGGPKDAAASDATIARHAGYAPLGFHVVEHRGDGAVIGFVGLKPGAPDTPIAGRLEIGWMIAAAYWGAGYAREAATAWLEQAWAMRDEDAVYAITARRNDACRALLTRLGMRHRPDLDFLHPVHAGDPVLADTVTYRIDRPQ